jgi:hypothetical protein
MKASTLAMVPCLCVLLASCEDPTISYSNNLTVNDQTRIVSPDEKEIPFALRSSNLLLAPASSSSSAIQSDLSSFKTTNICNTKNTPPLPTKPGAKAGAPAPASSSSSSEPAWQTCISGMRVTVSPAADPKNVYVATVGGDVNVSTQSIDGQPLLLKNVSLSQNSNTANTLTSIGSDVAAGAAIGTGWGWAAVGIAVLYQVTEQGEGMQVNGQPPPQNHVQHTALLSRPHKTTAPAETPSDEVSEESYLATAICSDVSSQVPWKSYSLKEKNTPVLSLPIAIEMDPTLFDSPGSAHGESCWRPVPGTKESGYLPLWFYRVISQGSDTAAVAPSGIKDNSVDITDVPPMIKVPESSGLPFGNAFKSSTEYFGQQQISNQVGQNGNTGGTPSGLTYDSATLNTLATSACRAVEVDFAWWGELAKVRQDQDKTKLSEASLATDPSLPAYQVYRLTVADPRYVQLVSIRKNEVINFNSPCGAYAAPSAAPASVTDPSSAAIQATANIIKAQSQAGSGTK